MIMRATLHDLVRNTYYGRWAGERPLFPAPESSAIAHNEPAASGRFAVFDGPERDFPENRSPPRWKFVDRPKRKVCAPGDRTGSRRRPRCSPLPS